MSTSNMMVIEKFQPKDVTSEMLEDAAALFSSSYGIWGPLAAEKMSKYCKPGMSCSSKILVIGKWFRNLVMHMNVDALHTQVNV